MSTTFCIYKREFLRFCFTYQFSFMFATLGSYVFPFVALLQVKGLEWLGSYVQRDICKRFERCR